MTDKNMKRYYMQKKFVNSSINNSSTQNNLRYCHGSDISPLNLIIFYFNNFDFAELED